MAATLADIVREHLDIDSLEDPGVCDAGFHSIPVADLRNALEAAYRAGATARERARASIRLNHWLRSTPFRRTPSSDSRPALLCSHERSRSREPTVEDSGEK
jgi:hypothetical protein